MTETGLGIRLKYYRKLREMTQEELADKVGIAPTHITNIERGKKGVSLEVLMLICKTLEISLIDVLPDEGKQDDLEMREKLISEVVCVMNALDTEKLGVVRTMVGALVG
jgi:transcriptional regulator with XRE-family HTH domain